MPFLTEELWQRLPRRSGDLTKSIMIAPYPRFDPNLNNPTAASQYEFLLRCSKGVKSLMAEYSIKRNAKSKGVATMDILASDSVPPIGCAVFVVTSFTTILLDIKGHIAVDTALQKAKNKLENSRKVAGRLKEIIARWDENDQRISKDAKAAELAKLEEAEAEVGNYKRSIEQFENLKLGGAA
ncbi:MAG: hypothetical protein Q9167_007402 [Letrouitia subvulpina]